MSTSGDLLRFLANRYRNDSELFLHYGQHGPAAVLERVAKDLESEREVYESEPLTLEEAVQESGYSYSTLQRKVANGEIPNVGGKRAPRIRRGDLPFKGTMHVNSEFVRMTEDQDFANSIIMSRASL